jgi:DNA modification methylase
MWSNPGDVVLSPFMGVGSEGYEAIKLGRRYVGIELKPAYYKQACKYLAEAQTIVKSGTLFDQPGGNHGAGTKEAAA